MPDEARTPNGCSYFNGRCFERLELEDGNTSVYAYFHDGSEYRFTGLTEVEAIFWVNQFDAGCYFNKEIRPGNYVRLRPPS